MIERLHERPVRGAHDRVARPVEDERAPPAASVASSRTSRLLPEPASPATSATRRTLVVGAREQRAQRRELVRAAHERERRPQAGRAGECAVTDSQI